jgi:hypothetical protein
MDRLSAVQVAQSTLREHPCGLEYLMALLEGAKSEVQIHGYLAETFRKKIFSAFCFWDHAFALVCLFAVPARAGTKGSTSKTEASNEDVIAVIEGHAWKDLAR